MSQQKFRNSVHEASTGCFSASGHYHRLLFLHGILAAILTTRVLAPPPVHSPGPISFNDNDIQLGEIGGVLEFPRASDESDITEYRVYFGSSPTTRLLLLVSLPATGVDPDYYIPMNTNIPSVASVPATYLLAFSANNDGENNNNVFLALHDRAVPVYGPSSITFFDNDLGHLTISGHVTLVRAASEVDVTNYIIYWGSGPSTLESLIVSFPKSSTLVHEFPTGTTYPTAATHIIAYTANADGLTESPAAIPLVDRAIPVHSATSIQFYDTDLLKGEVSGLVTIGRASDETIITNYAVYLAVSSTGPATVFLGRAPAVGSLGTVTYLIPADTEKTAVTTHLMVFTESDYGQMITGITFPLVDRYVPLQTATGIQFYDEDIDGGEIQGSITISRASDETDITRYTVFFANSAQQAVQEIGEIDADLPMTELNYTFPGTTLIPSGATRLLVKTGSADGLMATGLSTLLQDRAVPINPPILIQFVDEDSDAGQLGGHLTISRATDESDVTNYVAYFGNSAVAQVGAQLDFIGMTTVSSFTGSFAVFPISYHTVIPAGATHILAFSANADGEQRTGISTPIVDRTGDFPTVAVPQVTLIDLDLDEGEISGSITWFEPSNTAGLTEYTVFLAEDETGTARQQVGGAIPLGTSLTTVALDTPLRQFTHVIVYTNNFYGEGPGHAIAIVDRALPVAQVTALSFGDVDPGIGKVGGVVEWTAPAQPDGPTAFTQYTVFLSQDAAGDQSSLLGTVPVGTSTFTIPMETDVLAANLSYIIVYTENDAGQALAGTALFISDRFVPVVIVLQLQFFDLDLGTGEIGGKVGWTEPVDAIAGGAESYRVYFVKNDDYSNAEVRELLGEVPVGIDVLRVPFNTPLGNWSQICVVATNPAGEAFQNVSLTIIDRTADSCPAKVEHRFFSSQWRILAGVTESSWTIRAIRFYADSRCTQLLPTVPQGWPRHPRQARGAPFANPQIEKNLHEVFRPSAGTATMDSWLNGTELSDDPNFGPWWSTGSPCVSSNDTFSGDPGLDPDGSTCYLGFRWESDTFVNAAGQIRGSSGTIRNEAKAIHCVDIEQSNEVGYFSGLLIVQWYDVERGRYRNLLENRAALGGITRLSYQGLLAAECYEHGMIS